MDLRTFINAVRARKVILNLTIDSGRGTDDWWCVFEIVRGTEILNSYLQSHYPHDAGWEKMVEYQDGEGDFVAQVARFDPRHVDTGAPASVESSLYVNPDRVSDPYFSKFIPEACDARRERLKV